MTFAQSSISLVSYIWNSDVTRDATYQGFVTLNLSCVLEKLRQPGSVDVLGKKRQSVREAHLSRMKV
ncbi:hypothetical protein ACRRTK_006906 [Alexandromys fortis]